MYNTVPGYSWHVGLGRRRPEVKLVMPVVGLLTCLQKGSDGIRWDQMGSDGIRRDQMGSEGIRWDQMGSEGIRWDQMGSDDM